MRLENTPCCGAGYWAALATASVFGADCGDCVSHVLGLGHFRGLPVLLILFASTLMAERRSAFRSVAFYWAAIVLLRTGATNAGDLLTHDLRFGYLATSAVLLVLTVAAAAWAAAGERSGAPARALPAVDGRYWLTMGLAGTFGTVGGDALSRAAGHDPGLSTAFLVPAVLLATGFRRARGGLATYWLFVLSIRTIGTTFGDWGADRTTLLSGTALSGAALLIAISAASRPRPAARTATV